MEKFEAIIIGIGQAGNPLARTLAQQGQKVALVERSHPGGSCVNYGCTPTKTMIASAYVSHLAQTAEEVGIVAQSVQTDFEKVINRRDKLVEESRKNITEGIEQNKNIELLFGEACFSGPKRVKVVLKEGGNRIITADRIFLNVGTSSRIPAIEGLGQIPFLTAETIMELKEWPEHLLILGGGYIGLEYGQMYRRLGSQVTIVEQASSLVSQEDDDLAAAIKNFVEEEGITIYLGAEVRQVEERENKIRLTLQAHGYHTVTGTHLLVAVGTTPNTGVLQLHEAGIKTDEQGYITVGKHLETSVEGVFALGDCKGGPEFTHISYDDYRIVNDYLFGEKKRHKDDRPLLYTMFTHPELGRIGLNEKQAKEQGKRYQIARLPMEKVARAEEANEMTGQLKVLVDPVTNHILGAACLAAVGGELMTMLQIAMMGNLPYQRLRDGMFAHPTFAEAFNKLFATLEEPE